MVIVYIVLALFVVILFLTGILHKLLFYFVILGSAVIEKVLDPKLGCGKIVDELCYRHFWTADNVIETDNYLYCVIELIPISSDGFSVSDWNSLYNQLNALLFTLPEETVIQFDCYVTSVIDGTLERLKEHAKAQKNQDFRLILEARRKYLEVLAENGFIKNTRVFMAIGRPIKNEDILEQVSFLRKLFPKRFVKRSLLKLKMTKNEILRIRDNFMVSYTGLGGICRIVSAQEAFELIFEKLNPDVPEAPLLPYLSMEEPTENIYFNPAEALALSDLEFKNDLVYINQKPYCSLTIKNLPAWSTLGLIERLTRVAPTNFDFSFKVSLKIENQQTWEKHFSNLQRQMEMDLAAGNDASTRLQKQMKIRDIQDFKVRIRETNDLICKFGFNVLFTASNTEELKKRKEILLTAFSEMEGTTLKTEKNLPFDQFVQNLLCEDIERSPNLKPFLLRAAIGFIPFTGGNLGFWDEDYHSVFNRADNGIFFFHPQSKKFASGMSLIVGKTGSGKSVLLNRLRTDAMIEGRRLVSIDFDMSGESLVELVDGKIINFRNGGIGFFDIRPKPDEVLIDDSLDNNGIPKGRFEEVCNLIEQLCMPANLVNEATLKPAYTRFIRQKVYEVYQIYRNKIPTIMDFIRHFEVYKPSEKQIAHELIANLEKFVSSGFLADLLNTEEPAMEPRHVPYLLFDLKHVQNDPQMRMVSSFMVKMYVNRFLNTEGMKYLDVDEVQVISSDKTMSQLFNTIFATARKRKCYCVAASQSPAHFLNDALKDLRENAEVFWILPIKDYSTATEAFRLSEGQIRLVDYVSREGIGQDYRDIVLVYPGGTAHLRFRLNPLEYRLLAQRGREMFPFKSTLKFINQVSNNYKPSDRLLKALKQHEQ